MAAEACRKDIAAWHHFRVAILAAALSAHFPQTADAIEAIGVLCSAVLLARTSLSSGAFGSPPR
jgi:hypothetical protein